MLELQESHERGYPAQTAFAALFEAASFKAASFKEVVHDGPVVDPDGFGLDGACNTQGPVDLA
jgi:hypothetical protein